MVEQEEGKCTLYCFYNGFCTPKAPEVDAVLFFTSILKRLPLPPAPTWTRLGPGLDLACVAGKLSSRVAGVRFVSKKKVLYESGNVF